MKLILFKRKTFLTTIILISLLFCIGQAPSVFADDKYGLDKTAGAAGISTTKKDLPTAIGNLVGVVLSFLGIIFLVLTIYGGFLWMTAHGNEEQVKKARNIVVSAVIGLVVILSAYAITYFITTEFSKAVTTP